MTLAAIEGQVVLLALMAVFGLISWISKKLTTGASPPGSAPSEAPRETSARRAPAESEEQRMRRFLEALGVPQDETPPPLRPRPAVPARAPVPEPQRPRPSAPTPAPSRRSSAPPPLHTAPRSAKAAAEAKAPAHHSRTQEPTPSRPEYETVTSRISAAGTAGAREPVVADPYRGRDIKDRPLTETLRIALSSSQNLRAALLLREVLGPPIALRR